MEIDKSKVIKVPPVMIKEGSDKEEREEYEKIKALAPEGMYNPKDIKVTCSVAKDPKYMDYKEGTLKEALQDLSKAFNNLKEQMIEVFKIADIANKLK